MTKTDYPEKEFGGELDREINRSLEEHIGGYEKSNSFDGEPELEEMDYIAGFDRFTEQQEEERQVVADFTEGDDDDER